jgi:hypothetical protein
MGRERMVSPTLLTLLSQVWAGQLMKNEGLTSVQYTHALSPYAGLLLTVSSPCTPISNQPHRESETARHSGDACVTCEGVACADDVRTYRLPSHGHPHRPVAAAQRGCPHRGSSPPCVSLIRPDFVSQLTRCECKSPTTDGWGVPLQASLLATSTLAALVNVTGYWCIQTTSAVTYQVCEDAHAQRVREVVEATRGGSDTK